MIRGKFQVAPTDRIMTVGGCFAEHLGRHLERIGFFDPDSDAADTVHEPDEAGRRGRRLPAVHHEAIDTSRHLLQTLRRAHGMFTPVETMWERPDGRVVDPFRPHARPEGFASPQELAQDRERHFRTIRAVVRSMGVFVFTLALTECWESVEDGAVFPLRPGAAGGAFDPARHRFRNLRVRDVADDLDRAIGFVRRRNPSARFLLTVSPVGLAETAEDRSVLAATMYSKSVLRVAAEEVAAGKDHVAYFPSYEIILGNHTGGSYLRPDLRGLRPAGISRMLQLFLRHFTAAEDPGRAASLSPPPLIAQDGAELARQLSDELVRAEPEEG